MFPQHTSHNDDTCTCPESTELFARLDRAGITYERVSLTEAMRSTEPLFILPQLR